MSIISYIAVCFGGQTDYVPKLHSIFAENRSSYFEANGTDIKLDFHKGPTVEMCCQTFKLPFNFYDFSMPPLYRKMNVFFPNSKFEDRFVIDFGNSISHVSGEEFVKMLVKYKTRADIRLTDFCLKQNTNKFAALDSLLADKKAFENTVSECLTYESRTILQVTEEFIKH